MKLPKDKIDQIFEKTEHENCDSTLIEIFKTVFPNWDNIKKINGFVECSRELSDYICQKFIDKQIELNKKLPVNKHLLPGGYWLNYGFSSNEGTKGFEVKTENLEIEYNEV